VTLDQRLATHAIVGVVVDDEGVGLRHCPVFIEDTAAVKGGGIARYETADQARVGSTASIENPAATPPLGRAAIGLVARGCSIAENGAVDEGELAGVENPAPITQDDIIVSNHTVGQGRNARVLNTTAPRGRTTTDSIIGDDALGHHQLAPVLNATAESEGGAIIRDDAAMDPQRTALTDRNPAERSAAITDHSTTYQGPGAGLYRDTCPIPGHHAVFNGYRTPSMRDA
jgi:hypothetical protein